MACFLNDQWNAFTISKGNTRCLKNYTVYITHNTSNVIGVQEEGVDWKNLGISSNVGNIGLIFDLDWEDRSDSKGDGLKNSHHYRIKIISKDLLLQVATSNGENKFSFGNWFRGTCDQSKLQLELVNAAKNGDKDVYTWLKNGGYDMSKI